MFLGLLFAAAVIAGSFRAAADARDRERLTGQRAQRPRYDHVVLLHSGHAQHGKVGLHGDRRFMMVNACGTAKSPNRLALAAAGAVWLAACASKTGGVSRKDGAAVDLPSAMDAGASVATDQAAGGSAGTAADALVDATISEVAGSQPLILPGPCLEGMECNGNDPGGSREFRCTCTAGNWICPLHDTQGWLLSDLPLPTEDPQNATTCNGENYACTLPDRCGSLCICTQTQQWNCKTVQSDVDGGPVVTDGVPDAGISDSPDAGCAWPSCSVYGTAPPPGARCFTPDCFSTIYPSGSAFFTPGAGGCGREL
jgi:hypothetical protein